MGSKMKIDDVIAALFFSALLVVGAVCFLKGCDSMVSEKCYEQTKDARCWDL
jgi:hypothetical protein